MTKLWFKTKNDQIVDLNSFYCFSYRDPIYRVDPTDLSWYVEGNNVFSLGEFDTREEAQAYLDEIYAILTVKPKDWNAKEFWDKYWRVVND